jgi:hypothetical protein
MSLIIDENQLQLLYVGTLAPPAIIGVWRLIFTAISRDNFPALRTPYICRAGDII